MALERSRQSRTNFGREFLEASQIHNRGSFWAQKPSSVLIQLPTVVVDEFLDRLPLGRAESNGWISKIDQTGYLNMLLDPQDLLDLRLSTGRSGPVNGQAGRETQRVGCQHKVLNCRIDTRIPDLLTLANTV